MYNFCWKTIIDQRPGVDRDRKSHVLHFLHATKIFRKLIIIFINVRMTYKDSWFDRPPSLSLSSFSTITLLRIHVCRFMRQFSGTVYVNNSHSWKKYLRWLTKFHRENIIATDGSFRSRRGDRATKTVWHAASHYSTHCVSFFLRERLYVQKYSLFARYLYILGT